MALGLLHDLPAMALHQRHLAAVVLGDVVDDGLELLVDQVAASGLEPLSAHPQASQLLASALLAFVWHASPAGASQLQQSCPQQSCHRPASAVQRPASPGA